MDVDDRLLMSYVDGKLSLDDRLAAEASIAASTEIAERVAALRASCLPYRAAFEHLQPPAPPASLVDRVDELVSANRVPRLPRLQTRRARNSSYSMLAAFAAGMVFCAGALGLASGLWPSSSTSEPWTDAVAKYQSMYARETVAALNENPVATEQTLARLRRTMNPKLNVPNLLQRGLSLKRLQQLDFKGRPLVQLVYLPREGQPVALCLLGEGKPDEDVHLRTINGMRAATWRRDHLAYLLLTADPKIDVDQLAQAISTGKVATLYGDFHNS